MGQRGERSFDPYHGGEGEKKGLWVIKLGSRTQKGPGQGGDRKRSSTPWQAEKGESLTPENPER